MDGNYRGCPISTAWMATIVGVLLVYTKVVVVQVVLLAVDTAGFADDMLAGAVYPINGIGAELGQGVTCAAFTEVVPTVLRLLVVPDALDRGACHKTLDFVGRRECFVQW